MNSPAGSFNLFAQAASLSMLQTMHGYAAAAAAADSLRQAGGGSGGGVPTNYYLHGGAPLPQLRLPHATTTSTGSILNARLLGAPPQLQTGGSQQQPPPPPPLPQRPDTRPVSSGTSIKPEVDRQQQQRQPEQQPASAPQIGELVETTLEGKSIFAFDVGGEKRLCLPQVLNKVLLCAGATLGDINRVCEDLNIFCDRCNTQQMGVLKERKVFGPVLESCGLITKSNAERLCKALLNAELPKFSGNVTGEDGIGVYHGCFGKQRGFLIPRLYTSPEAPCIVCNGCSAMLSPPQFVGHAHSRPERETCHWGFDSNNWRLYLLLDKRLTDSAADGCLADSERACLEKVLDGVKAKFDQRKRPQTSSIQCPEPAKRCKTEASDDTGSTVVPKFLAPLPPTFLAGSAKVPLPSGLRHASAGPPVLLNSDLGRPGGGGGGGGGGGSSSSEHRDYAPNVRLAPATRAPGKVEGAKPVLDLSGAAASSIEDMIASDWDSLTDWGEGHLPEKATPQFLAMVEKVKSGYRTHIDDLKVQVARLRAQLSRAEQLELEAARLRRQLEEQGSPDVRRLRMKYSAQKEELRQLEAERTRLQSALASAAAAAGGPSNEADGADNDAVVAVAVANSADAAGRRSSPPALELQQQQQ